MKFHSLLLKKAYGYDISGEVKDDKQLNFRYIPDVYPQEEPLEPSEEPE